ncbi:hypothetical protein [Acidovorax sp. CCYZU-2555]|uniref:hypothetical protein n=1 Tax=Acidovorax sp. CCYZU-2555 TaxID=2835042 RepID=UPI0020BE3F0C|nr:hypothetical protein [Acidovorax sp. CCYZU-2555]
MRLVLLFLVLALAMTVTFIGGMQSAFSVGWSDAARPLLADYVDRLLTEIGSPPSVERAQAIVQRLPIMMRIEGPQVQWTSHSRNGLMERWLVGGHHGTKSAPSCCASRRLMAIRSNLP